MKTFIASDFHGADPTGLVRSLEKSEGIERAVFLGDYDEPEILENILNLDIERIVLVGNHDYNFAYGKDIYSLNLRRTLEEYWEIWKNSEAGKFVRDNVGIVNESQVGYKRIGNVGERRVVYVHGSLIPSYDEEAKNLWGRLWDSSGSGFSHVRRIECNFLQMIKDDYWTMFRGHDHTARIFYATPKENGRSDLKIEESFESGKLEKGGMNIVSLGAFVEGEYALFDDESLELEFRMGG